MKNTELIRAVLLAVTVVTAYPLWASGVAWDDLTTQQQQVLAPLRNSWDQLPAERQEKLRRGADHWDSMSPEHRDRGQAAL